MTLPTRPLGQTGVTPTVLGLGCGPIGFGNVPHADGVAVVQRAVELGVTYVDTAHHYESEAIVGDALVGVRDRVFLATKTIKRSYAAAWDDLRLSLKQLRTDRIDLYQMHCVNTVSDLDAVLAPSGSLACALEAQREGLVRFIGITGHARPNVLALALERFPFDVVLIAMGAIDTLVTLPQHFFLPTARRVGCGVVAMKVLGGGRLTSQPGLALRYALGLGADVAVIGPKTVSEAEQLVALAREPAPLTPAEESQLLTLAREHVAPASRLPFWLTDAEVLAYRTDWVGAAAS